MTTDQEARLLIDERGSVAWLTMNRPERRNAMNPALVDALRYYFQALPGRRDVRVVVLQGAGRAYCAGLDLKHTAELMGSGPAKTLDDSFATQYSIKDILLEAVMAIEDRNQMLATRDGNFKEGLTAFLEKCPPQYGPA